MIDRDDMIKMAMVNERLTELNVADAAVIDPTGLTITVGDNERFWRLTGFCPDDAHDGRLDVPWNEVKRLWADQHKLMAAFMKLWMNIR